jgi:glyceraldehyde-3-phosphate dehydrogenase/erythrose-4-phosphate dehydrogenase
MDAHRDEPATKKDLNQVKQELTGKIDADSAKIDRIALQVIENHEQIERRATREELNQRFDEVISGQDKMMTILTRLDEERVATNARIDRIEGDLSAVVLRQADVETNKSEIKMIKTKLAMDA